MNVRENSVSYDEVSSQNGQTVAGYYSLKNDQTVAGDDSSQDDQTQAGDDSSQDDQDWDDQDWDDDEGFDDRRELATEDDLTDEEDDLPFPVPLPKVEDRIDIVLSDT